MKIHGQKQTRLYKIWENMLARTRTKSSSYYKDYGGRGIKVSSEWKNFSSFFRDMGKSYQCHVKKHGVKETTLDRKNNAKDYNRENCRWATQQEQQRNKRNNVVYKGETAVAAAERLGKRPGRGGNFVSERIRRYKWTKKDAFTVPLCCKLCYRIPCVCKKKRKQ